MATEYTSYYDAMIRKLKKKAEESIRQIMPAVWADYFRFAEQSIKVMFKDVVKDFYADYTPIIYDRNYGLFDLLETEVTSEQLSVRTNPLNMTGYRNGYKGDSGLYDLVFRHGWHGGADHGARPGRPVHAGHAVRADRICRAFQQLPSEQRHSDRQHGRPHVLDAGQLRIAHHRLCRRHRAGAPC